MSGARILLPPSLRTPDALPADVWQLSGRCMGTTWQLRAGLDSEAEARRLREAVAALLEDCEAQMSHFRATSALSRFGGLAAGERMTLPPHLARVMASALEIAQASEGAFDPTLAAAIDAWGFGAGNRFAEPGFVPGRSGPAGGWRRLELEGDVLLQPGGVRLNLAAIAKGYAVDAVAALLVEQGCVHHLVEVGGELRGAGVRPDAQPWWVALENPADDCPLPPLRVALHELAVASSGNYRRAFTYGGKLQQHTLSPFSGEPVQHALAVVSVLAPRCMEADAWATALMVAGPEAGAALAAQHGLAARLLWQDAAGAWQEKLSPAFQTMLE